ncbi:MAG: DNA-directed RNA polymerase subunit beta' [Bacillota bacterium]
MEFKDFDKIRIGLASPADIRSWSYGEVKKPETINYRTLKPEDDGLFCQRIFGPTKDLQCACGKYKRARYKGVVCEKCGVEVTSSKVRRERMGHIELAAPVSHIWYFKGIPSKLGIILDMSPKDLEKVLYFASYIVMDAKDTSLTYKQILSEKEYADAREKYRDGFDAAMGAESVKTLLKHLDLSKEISEMQAKMDDSKGQKRKKLLRRLKLLKKLKRSGNKPEWIIMDVFPVVPPDIRPMVQLDGGRFATSDLNDLYRRVINRNNRLKRLSSLGAPDIIVKNEKRMLQESVDALIDNGRRGRPVTGSGNRALKSLSDMLKGKQGRFRQNLLGKRVDYSGRSVIVIGPELKFYQCGLPKTMALELFKPFVMRKLVEDEIAHNIKSAKRMVEKKKAEVWPIVEHVIKDHPVMLNRAPTLHRLGIQAFEPVLVEGKAIKLHPLACPPYNADFDGDQMAVHVPLSVEAQAEARFLMLSVNNILAPKDGEPITLPSQDMVLGAYYLTTKRKEEGHQTDYVFKDYNEMLTAYQNDYVDIYSIVKVRVYSEKTNDYGIAESTVGRFIFNENIPQDLGFVDREKHPYKLEVDFLTGKKQLAKIADRCFRKHGNTETSELLDHMKALGFRYSTISGISIGLSDMVIPEKKEEYIEEAHKIVDKYQKAYRRGLMSNKERYEKTIDQWGETTEKVTEALISNLDYMNNIKIMADSGARGSRAQIRQLAGMRGLMANAVGKTVEIPITSNFREGLNVLEYFISTTGARKGLADTALRTADSGYLTRRLVDVSQDVVVKELDCKTEDGIIVSTIKEGNEIIEKLEERLYGRYPANDIYYPETNDLIISSNEMFDHEKAKEVVNAGIEKVELRSALNCEAEDGICAKCYGLNLATGKLVNIGEAVGIISAQSIGEPGTQLTMRTFHTGGVAGGEDITQGLPRVEQLFEARTPKYLANIAQRSGKVTLRKRRKKREVLITDDEGNTSVSRLAYNSKLKVSEGDHVEKGDFLTEGVADPKEIIEIRGVNAVQEYIVKEIQKVYRLQGVEIADKHSEVIIRQMLNKIVIEDPGDSKLVPTEKISYAKYKNINKKLREEGKKEMTGERIIQGITKASLGTESFLSAASFQETTRVLTGASLDGAVDDLKGLKENVIIGKLIPAGTGLEKYQSVAVENNQNFNE